MRFYYDEQGRYRGHSSGLLVQSFKFFFLVFGLMFVLAWPTLIHGLAGAILEGVWVILLIAGGFLMLALKGSRGLHQADPRSARSEPSGSRGRHQPFTGPDRW